MLSILFTLQTKLTIFGSSVGKEQSMIMWYQILDRKLRTYMDVADEIESRGFRDFGEGGLAVLYIPAMS